MNMKQAGIITRLWDLMMTRRDIVFPSWEAGFVYSMKRKAIRHGWDLTLKQELKLEELAMTYLGVETLNEVYEADLEAVEQRVVNAYAPDTRMGQGDLSVQLQLIYRRLGETEEQVKHLEDRVGPPPSVVRVQIDDLNNQINEVRLQIEAMVEHFEAWDKVISGFGRDVGYEKDVRSMICAVTHLSEHDMSVGMFDVCIVGRTITITFADAATSYFTARNQTAILKRIRNWAAVHFLVRFEQARVA